MTSFPFTGLNPLFGFVHGSLNILPKFRKLNFSIFFFKIALKTRNLNEFSHIIFSHLLKNVIHFNGTAVLLWFIHYNIAVMT